MKRTAPPSPITVGHCGRENRSDCRVQLDLAGPPGMVMKSKVDRMFGRSLGTLLEEGVAALGLQKAAVVVEDEGALPWVIQARLEAAAMAAHPGQERRWPLKRRAPLRAPERDRLRRSRLYLPGNTPKFLLNAARHRPDGIILDLEDSVAPARKAEARVLVRAALRVIDFTPAEVMVRINQLPAGMVDLEAIVPEGVQMILVPKAEDPDQIVQVAAVAGELAREHGLSEPLLMPIIESARGAWKAYEIASASPQVAALTIGLEDYTADLGTERTPEGRESFWARCQVVNAARAAGVVPIDTVWADVEDMEGLQASVREARSLGFVGKGCIHPRQIGPIHQAMAPTPTEIEKAQRIVGAFEQALARGDGVVALGSKMIDAPVVERARHTVELARRMGLTPATEEKE